MQPAFPEVIRPMLDSYLTTVDRELSDLLVGFYVYGSIALGAFQENSSDIDAIAVVNRRCGTYEIDRLLQIHAAINRSAHSGGAQSPQQKKRAALSLAAAARS